ncbi:MAG: efflux RND transporter periplasmic adaptor subunit [Terriglobia bacterium]
MKEREDLLKELRIERDSRRGARWVWLLLLLPVALLAVSGWWWLGVRPAAEVRTMAVQETGGSGSHVVLNASGYVTARRQATISSKITGKIVEVLVEEGMEVREGEVLARLDDATPRANLALAEAQMEAARQSLAETEVRLEEARRTLRRTQGLVEGQIASQAELDAAQAEVDSLGARLALGREQVAVAERQMGVWQQRLEDTVIRAPFSGVVVSKDAQPGEMISPVSAGGGFTRTGICTVVDMSSLEIEVDVNENYIARVEPGQRVEATLDAYPNWQIPARVITTVPTADRQKATVRVRIAFEELDPRLLPDMGVKVRFLDSEPATAGASRPRLLIPRAAVRQHEGSPVAYVVAGERAERRALRLGASEGDQVVVLAGLSAGEQVVVEGPAELADGDRVTTR